MKSTISTSRCIHQFQRKDADERFERLRSEIESYTRRKLGALASDARVGNILGVDVSNKEIRVSQNGKSELLTFAFDSFDRELNIIHTGEVKYERTIRVQTEKTIHLADQRLRGEPFMPISANNLPEIVNDAINALLGRL